MYFCCPLVPNYATQDVAATLPCTSTLINNLDDGEATYGYAYLGTSNHTTRPDSSFVVDTGATINIISNAYDKQLNNKRPGTATVSGFKKGIILREKGG